MPPDPFVAVFLDVAFTAERAQVFNQLAAEARIGRMIGGERPCALVTVIAPKAGEVVEDESRGAKRTKER